MTKPRSPLAFWLLLAASVLGLAGLASRFVAAENERQEEARARLLASQSAALHQRLEAYFHELQTETAAQLVALHAEGLPRQLERWNAANPLVATAQIHPPSPQDPWPAPALRSLLHLDHAEIDPYLRSGYYQENRDIAAYETGQADPLLVWTLDPATAQWTVWHRLAPGLPTRSASLDPQQLLSSLDSLLQQFAGPGFAARIAPASDPHAAAPIDTVVPDHAIALSLAPDQLPRPWPARFGYALVAACLALFAACAFLINRQAQSERRQALRKTSFVSQVSHELKTPLTSIALYSDLLREPGVTEDKRARYLDTISRESQRLTQLIEDLLALSSVERSQRRYTLQPIDLGPCLASILADFRPVLERAGMSVNLAPLPRPIAARADPAALRQVVLNLLDNARKYARSGSTLSIEIAADSQRAAIAFADQGPGIPRSLREKIFEPFFQQNSSLADKSPGAGLGLSIARQILRDCGGDLSLDPNYTGGARFVAHLPLAP